MPVRVWPRAPLNEKKIVITSDKNKSSLRIKLKLLKILKNNNLKHNNLNIVIGGDGFMLKTLKKKIKVVQNFFTVLTLWKLWLFNE